MSEKTPPHQVPPNTQTSGRPEAGTSWRTKLTIEDYYMRECGTEPDGGVDDLVAVAMKASLSGLKEQPTTVAATQ